MVTLATFIQDARVTQTIEITGKFLIKLLFNIPAYRSTEAMFSAHNWQLKPMTLLASSQIISTLTNVPQQMLPERNGFTMFFPQIL